VFGKMPKISQKQDIGQQVIPKQIDSQGQFIKFHATSNKSLRLPMCSSPKFSAIYWQYIILADDFPASAVPRRGA
jgi:hypothetical protein